jgi:hypothetical protein
MPVYPIFSDCTQPFISLMLTVLLFAAAALHLTDMRPHNLSAGDLLKDGGEPLSAYDDYIFIACYGGTYESAPLNLEKLGECCGKAPTSGDCPLIPQLCSAYMATGDIPINDGELVCLSYCAAINYRLSWCQIASPTFLACYGRDPEYPNADFEQFGKCCATQEKEFVCKTLQEYCYAYYEGEILDDSVEANTETACEAFCSESKQEPKWCPSGLSAGAIVGIVIAAIVVVGAIAGVSIFFLVIRKGADAENPQEK